MNDRVISPNGKIRLCERHSKQSVVPSSITHRHHRCLEGNRKGRVVKPATRSWIWPCVTRSFGLSSSPGGVKQLQILICPSFEVLSIPAPTTRFRWVPFLNHRGGEPCNRTACIVGSVSLSSAGSYLPFPLTGNCRLTCNSFQPRVTWLHSRDRAQAQDHMHHCSHTPHGPR